MLTETMENNLAKNPRFRRALIEVVIEPSEAGLAVFDDRGRYIIVEPWQVKSVSERLDASTEG